MNKTWMIVGILVVIVLAVVMLFFLSQRAPAQIREDKSASQIGIGQQPYSIEVAQTSQQQQLGLSGRDEIGSDGMLFVFAAPSQPAFWMKDMKFALDFVWIVNGKIAEITVDVPYPMTEAENSDAELPRYRPAQPIEMMLEVTAGYAAAQGWQVGDPVKLSI